MPPKKKISSEIKKANQNQYEALLREIHYGAECVKRHEENWRKILISIAEPRMRMELEYAMHHFERSLDDKDFEISLLLDELRAAEYQHSRSICSHVDDIDHIIELCYDQTADLWRESVNMISNLFNAGVQERADIIRINSEHDEYLKTMLYSIQDNSREVGKLMRGEYLSRQEFEISRLNDIGTKFKDELRVYYENIWKDAENLINKYQEDFSKKLEVLKELKKNDQITMKTLSELFGKCCKANEETKALQSQFDQIKSDSEKIIKDLSCECDFFEDIAHYYKVQCKKGISDDAQNLKQLSVISSDVIKHLEKFAKKGDRLLVLCEICRKLETIEEKTLSFPSFIDAVPKSKVVQRLIQANQTEEQEEETDLMPELDMLWLRLGRLEAQKWALIEEINALTCQNAELKEKIVSYCERLNCEQSLKFLLQYPHLIPNQYGLSK